MAGFLRRKSTQDGKMQTNPPARTKATSPPPPLFAKFATSRKISDASPSQRIVSTPMHLNGHRMQQEPVNGNPRLHEQTTRTEGKFASREQSAYGNEARAEGYTSDLTNEGHYIPIRPSKIVEIQPTPSNVTPIPRLTSVDKPLPPGPDPGPGRLSNASPQPVHPPNRRMSVYGPVTSTSQHMSSISVPTEQRFSNNVAISSPSKHHARQAHDVQDYTQTQTEAVGFRNADQSPIRPRPNPTTPQFGESAFSVPKTKQSRNVSSHLQQRPLDSHTSPRKPTTPDHRHKSSTVMHVNGMAVPKSSSHHHSSTNQPHTSRSDDYNTSIPIPSASPQDSLPNPGIQEASIPDPTSVSSSPDYPHDGVSTQIDMGASPSSLSVTHDPRLPFDSQSYSIPAPEHDFSPYMYDSRSRPNTKYTASSAAPLRGKPLIFAAMSAVEQGADPPAPAPWDDHALNAYPSPPSDHSPAFGTSFSKTLESVDSHVSASSSSSVGADSRSPHPRTAPGTNHHVPAKPSLSSSRHHHSPSHARKTKSPVNAANGAPQDGTAVTRRVLTKKMRPTTPVSLDPPIELDVSVARNAGLPLDDDPFAKVEGVRMLKPSLRDTPSPSKNGVRKNPIPSDAGGVTVKDAEARSVDEAVGPISNTDAPPKATVHQGVPSPPASPDDYKHARSRRRGEKLEKAPPPTIADVVIREDKVPGPFPLALYLSDSILLSSLLAYLSFYDWCVLSSVSKEIRTFLIERKELREEVLERFLSTVGYTRWEWDVPDPLPLSLPHLSDYMRGVSIPTHEYARIAESYVHSGATNSIEERTKLLEKVRELTSSCRAYTRVVLRLRAQAEAESRSRPQQASTARVLGNPAAPGAPSRASSRAPSPTQSSFSHSHAHSVVQAGLGPLAVRTPSPPGTVFRSPLYRLRRAPLLRVFVPSQDGDWLSDSSVLECEAELKRAGVLGLLRMGDVVWDVAVGDEGNIGRMVWDGSYLIDLDYSYSPVGDLPKYLPTLAFSPSYFHRVIRTGPSVSNPIAHIDISPWGEEIASNLQLLQDRVRTETPQGVYHNVIRWIHRSSFTVRPPKTAPRSYNQSNNRFTPQTPRIPISDSDNLFVDPGWYGTVVVETEGTNEHLADLRERCGPGAFPPRAVNRATPPTLREKEAKKVFRILRERSRPGEIWIRTVGEKERLI